MNIVRCPKPPRRVKTQNGYFSSKITLCLKKVTTKFLRVNTVSDKVVSHSLAMQKWFAGDVPYYVKSWPKLTNPIQKPRFQSIFARSASAVTPSERSSINTNRKSTTSFSMSQRWKCTLSLSPQRAAKDAKCPKRQQ